MGFFGFFKDKEVVEEPLGEVGFSEVDLLLEVKMGEVERAVVKIKEEISGKVVEFVSDLRKRIDVLNLIDLVKKREDERIKFMTMKGLGEYVEQLDRFVGDLGEVDRGVGFFEYVRGIDLAVDFFIRNSRKKLHKATILIGKELAETEELIKVFHKEVNVIVSGSAEVTSKMKRVERLRILEGSVVEAKRIREEVDDLILDLEKKKKGFVDERARVEEEFGLFEKGEEYKDWLDAGEAFEREGEVLAKSVGELRGKVNIKLLMNKFHGVPRSLELLKSYRDDFLNALMSDEGFRILDMIEGDEKEVAGEGLKSIFERRQYLKVEGSRYKVNKKREILRGDLERVSRRVGGIDKEIEVENKKLTKFVEEERELREERVKIIEGVLGVRVVEGV